MFCCLGCVSCLYIQIYFGSPSFVASIIVGFIGSFLPRSSMYNVKKGVASIYCGSFAGMSSSIYLVGLIDYIVLGLLVGFYFSIIGDKYRGLGGKLGAIGFIASVTLITIKSIL